MAIRSLAVLLAAALLSVTLAAAPARAAEEITDADRGLPPGYHEQVLELPGNPKRPVELQVTLLTPDGPGPFPLAILNHGVGAHGERPSEETRYRISFSAFYFLARGYAVAMPMLRGFAGSGGSPNFYGCDYERVGVENAKDIRAVIDDTARRPDIDATRIIVSGQSFGGWNSLALGSLGVPNVKGLVVFAGGVRTSDCDNVDNSLIVAAGLFGARTAIPSIWFYGDNDSLFPPSTWRGMHRRYTAAGGHAELVGFGDFRDDAHYMLNYRHGLEIWVPKVDAFLEKIGLPNKVVYPQYMPTAYPRPSRYAAIDDADSVPFLSIPNQAYYRRFLTKPLPRALAISPNGSAGSSDDGFDPIAAALKRCGKTGVDCQR
jgi:dienelactone hydrolase